MAVLVGLATGLCRDSTAEKKKPIVAVFEVEAKNVTLSQDTLTSLTSYIASKLTESGVYEVVPQDRVKQALSAKKKDSYEECYDQSCQIEIGQAVAATEALSTLVMKFGSKCMVTCTLFDLKRETASKAATTKGGCDEDGISASIDDVMGKLGKSTRHPAPRVLLPSRGAPPGRLNIVGRPNGLKVTVKGAREKAPRGGQWSCNLPCELGGLKLGSYLVEAKAAGHLPFSRWVWIDAGKAVQVSLALEPQPTPPVTVAAVPPPLAERRAESAPIYKRWWFWTVIGAAVAGGTIGAVTATTGGSDRVPGGDRFDLTSFRNK
jgi:hypothetical protein